MSNSTAVTNEIYWLSVKSQCFLGAGYSRYYSNHICLTRGPVGEYLPTSKNIIKLLRLQLRNRCGVLLL
jgi:hypothetical protein